MLLEALGGGVWEMFGRFFVDIWEAARKMFRTCMEEKEHM